LIIGGIWRFTDESPDVRGRGASSLSSGVNDERRRRLRAFLRPSEESRRPGFNPAGWLSLRRWPYDYALPLDFPCPIKSALLSTAQSLLLKSS